MILHQTAFLANSNLWLGSNRKAFQVQEKHLVINMKTRGKMSLHTSMQQLAKIASAESLLTIILSPDLNESVLWV